MVRFEFWSTILDVLLNDDPAQYLTISDEVFSNYAKGSDPDYSPPEFIDRCKGR